MKPFLITLVMAGILFLYGYLLSVAGHDHSAHERKGVSGEHLPEENHEHHHDHSH